MALVRGQRGLLEEAIYPELKVTLCLVAHRWLLRVGRGEDAFSALRSAFTIATTARDQLQSDRIHVEWARACAELGHTSRAREMYNELIAAREAADENDYVRVAMLDRPAFG